MPLSTPSTNTIRNLPTRLASCTLVLGDTGTGLLFRQTIFIPLWASIYTLPQIWFEHYKAPDICPQIREILKIQELSIQIITILRQIYSSTSQFYITVSQNPTLSSSCKPLVLSPLLSAFFLWLLLSLFLSQYV